MKRTELQRTATGRCQFHRWVPDPKAYLGERCANCGRERAAKLSRPAEKKSTTTSLKRGRGFAASPQQQKKVKGSRCLACSALDGDYLTVDPAHICAKGMGGCDDPLCVIPLCRWANGEGCHRKFDRGELDLLADLEPAHRAEVAHAVMHLGLEGTRRRLAPSQYRDGVRPSVGEDSR